MFCVKAGRLEGKFAAPPSKPYSQRLLLASALADGETVIRGVEWSDDFTAMFRAVQPLARLYCEGGVVKASRREPDFYRSFNVMESGFTLRTAVAVYAGVPGITAVYYGGTLKGRPIDELVEALRRLTAVEKTAGAIVVEGRRLEEFDIEIRADISSQYISGLMYLAAHVGRGIVRPVGERKSWSFVEATAEVLKKFGARVELGETIEVEGPLRSPRAVDVPSDFSLAAFLVVAGIATGGHIELLGTLAEVDKWAIDVFRQMGADITIDNGIVRVGGVFTRGVDVDLGRNPDLVMPVALAAAMVEEESAIRGVDHLRYKESDRVATVLDVLRRLGVEVRYDKGAIYIRGPPTKREVAFQTHGDHRIGLMALAAAKIVGGCVDDLTPVAKSWPSSILYFKG